MTANDYEQPQAIYPVIPPPIEEKRECHHTFKDVSAFGSPYISHICLWCGEVRKEIRGLQYLQE